MFTAVRVQWQNNQLISAGKAVQAILVEKEGCTWVDSKLEMRFHEELMRQFQDRQNVLIEKPIDNVILFDGRHPDYVITVPHAPMIIIEIWGMSKKADYFESQVKRQRYYRKLEKQGKIRFLEWDVQKNGNKALPELFQQLRTWLE